MRSKIAVAVTAAVLLGAGTPTAAQAARCSIGKSNVSYNRAGDAARFWNLTAHQGMNCPSARYVLNRWLRRAFERSYKNQLPLNFYDGYVTWYCGKLTSTRWRCREYDSNTSFRFNAEMI